LFKEFGRIGIVVHSVGIAVDPAWFHRQPFHRAYLRILYIYGLFKDAASDSAYIASNGRINY
jgi:hypothetical protein